jgi:tight adherence protein B
MVTLSLPLVAAILAAGAVFLIFMALWLLMQRRDPVDQRLIQYGVAAELVENPGYGELQQRYPSALHRFLSGFGLGPRLALSLTRADVPMTAAEFTMLALLLGVVGFAIGTLRLGVGLGLVVGALLGYIPFVALTVRQARRLRRITQQIPDMLTLVVGGLRAGYGLSQALNLVVERISDPMSGEIAKVMRGISLGMPLQTALLDASSRIGSDDFHLVVVAINVQHETGGNLAVTLETIGDTVRDRLQMLDEIRVLTAQQRFTGYVLGAMPIVVGLVVSLINPEYMRDLFAPGWVRVLPISAGVLQILGFMMIQRIVDIEV